MIKRPSVGSVEPSFIYQQIKDCDTASAIAGDRRSATRCVFVVLSICHELCKTNASYSVPLFWEKIACVIKNLVGYKYEILASNIPLIF